MRVHIVLVVVLSACELPSNDLATARGALNVDPRTFGANCLDAVDDTAAFQVAAAALNAHGTGGVLEVTASAEAQGNDCTYRVGGPIDFTGHTPGATDAKVILQGSPGVRIAVTGNAQTPIFSWWGVSGSVRDVEFVGGTPDIDAQSLIRFGGHEGDIRDSLFYGVKAHLAVVWSANGALQIRDTTFGGCSTSPYNWNTHQQGFGVVFVGTAWWGTVSIDRVVFADYGQSWDAFRAKGSPNWWILAGGVVPGVYGGGGAYSPGTFAVTNSQFDEGAFQAVWVNAWNSPVDRVIFNDNSVLTNVVSSSGGLIVTNAGSVEVERTVQSVRDNGSTHTSYFFDFAGVRDISFAHNHTWIQFGAQAVIRTDAATQTLRLRDTVYSALAVHPGTQVVVE